MKLFLVGVTAFAMGGFFLGVSFIVQAMGSIAANTAGYLGFFFLFVGLILIAMHLD